MLLAERRWNEPAMKATIYQGLNVEILTELVCQDKKVTLDSLTNLAIHLDYMILSCSYLSQGYSYRAAMCYPHSKVTQQNPYRSVAPA